jgi:hypothetical protein
MTSKNDAKEKIKNKIDLIEQEVKNLNELNLLTFKNNITTEINLITQKIDYLNAFIKMMFKNINEKIIDNK